MGELIWGNKTVKTNSKTLDRLNKIRLILFIKSNLNIIFENIKNISVNEFKDDGLFFEHMVIRVIIAIFDRVNYDFELIETEINYETKSVDVVLHFDGIEIKFYKE